MQIRWLGWAGFEIEAEGETLVVDLLSDPGPATGGLTARSLPTLAPPRASRSAVAGLCTHLHRDHVDAAALSDALAADAPVLVPASFGGDDHENLWVRTGERELDEAGLRPTEMHYWERTSVGPFVVSAIPAVDALGDPQVSWAIEAGGRRVVHLGDSMFHGYWWRAVHRFGPVDVALLPINGPAVCFPHCQPPSPFPASLDADHAAVAGRLLQADVVVPMHYDGFHIDGYYETQPAELERFRSAAAGEPYDVAELAVGHTLTI